MTIQDRRAIAVTFVMSILKGHLVDAVLAPEFWAWTITSGNLNREEYRSRVSTLQHIFSDSLNPVFDALTAEEDRVALQFRAHATLLNGQLYANDYHFLVEFDTRDRVRHIREYFNTITARELLLPAIQERLAKQATQKHPA